MTTLREIYKAYTLLREQGEPAESVLAQLKEQIGLLGLDDEKRLRTRIQQFEDYLTHQQVATTEGGHAHEAESSLGRETIPMRNVNMSELIQRQMPIICEVCGTMNTPTLTSCVKCGSPLVSVADAAANPKVGTAKLTKLKESHFTPQMVLLLRVPSHNHVFELRPQSTDRELLVGRSDIKTSLIPEVDLMRFAGAFLGVSRRHMSIFYDASQSHLFVRDLGSRNGVYHNGRLLASNETSLLRHGDQLELGRMILNVLFAYDA